MNHRRRFWDELLVALEESLSAFSGVNPDLIDAHHDSQNLSSGWSRYGSSAQRSALSTGRRNTDTRSRTTNRGR